METLPREAALLATVNCLQDCHALLSLPSRKVFPSTLNNKDNYRCFPVSRFPSISSSTETQYLLLRPPLAEPTAAITKQLLSQGHRLWVQPPTAASCFQSHTRKECYCHLVRGAAAAGAVLAAWHTRLHA